MLEEGLGLRVQDAILVDEVGIETGRYGPFLLKTRYRPVFCMSDDGLIPCGVTALTQPLRGGRPVPRHAFIKAVTDEDLLFVECLCRMLHLRNHPNIGVDGMRLFLGHRPCIYRDAETALGEVDAMGECLEDIAMDPALVVFGIGESAAGGLLDTVAARLRHHGMRIAADDFGVGHNMLARVRQLDADVVRLDGGWFRRIAGVAVAARLLAPLVQALQREGRQVMVDGIDAPGLLGVALDIGADLVEGDLLRPAALAGSLVDMTPVKAEDILGGKVVPLFGSRARPA